MAAPTKVYALYTQLMHELTPRVVAMEVKMVTSSCRNFFQVSFFMIMCVCVLVND